jgi:hypothetical protein
MRLRYVQIVIGMHTMENRRLPIGDPGAEGAREKV